jgi:hypothetical protein
MDEERSSCLLEARPDRIEVRMRERPSGIVRLVGVDHEGVAAVGETVVDESAGSLGPKPQGCVADGLESLVVGTEGPHCPIERSRSRDEDVLVPAVDDLVVRVGSQHELHLEAEQLEAMRSLLRVERAQPTPAALAGVEQTGLERPHRGWIGATFLEQLSAPLHRAQ